MLENYNIFDFQLRSSSPTNTYTKTNVSISTINGTTVTFYPNDSDNPSIISPVIVFQNNTGYQINQVYIKASTSSNWGSDLSPWYLPNGESRTLTLPANISNNGSYDIRVSTSSGAYYTKNVTMLFGMIIIFTANDHE
ncbi:MAG: hypothetical protein FWD78_02470 [Treponema sp.]|nr:hypothetical protein [Treponema sp.]